MLTPVIEQIRQQANGLNKEPRRLFHGRGATVPDYAFLTIDWYPPIVLVTLYEPQSDVWQRQLAEAIKTLLGAGIEGIAVQDRSKAETAPRVLYGTVAEQSIIEENGLRFFITPLARQNIGFFPDMRPGRQLVRRIAGGKSVLNLFAYTCAFSVAAIAGSASRVVNLDMNRNLLQRGRENHSLNHQDLRQVSFLPYNLFKSFGRLQKLGPFDLVIIDPPYQQGTSFKAERDWPKILRKLPSLLSCNGEVVAAVSAPKLGRSFLRQQFESCLPAATILAEIAAAGEDFPESEPDKGLHIQHYLLQAT